MGIQPTSDLILDVVRAADPQRSQAMATRLKQASATGRADAGAMAFTDTMDEVQRLPGGFSPMTATSAMALHNATALSAKSADLPADDPYRRFEAMVLGGFVGSMLPSHADSVFGAGMAGNVWRSMLAERIATEVAKSGGIGIADRIAAHEGHGAVGGRNQPSKADRT